MIAVIAALALPRGAAAEEPIGVVIACADAKDPIALRIESELVALGIPVRILSAGDDAGAQVSLASIGASSGAAAVIRIGAKDRTIEVWTAAGEEPEGLVADEGEEDGDRQLAIAAAELVRARLLGAPRITPPAAEAPPPPDEPAAEAPPAVADAEPAAPPPSPRRPRLALDLGPAVMAAGLDLNPTVNVFLAASISLVGPLSVELFGATPLVPARAENRAGRMRMHTALAGGGLRLGTELGAGLVALYAAPGFTAFFAVLASRAAAGYDSHDETVTAAAPILRLGASVRLAAHVRLGIEALGAVALSEIAVRLGGSEVARVGRPILGGVVCLEVIPW